MKVRFEIKEKMPEITPLNNILDSELLDTSIESEGTLRNYAAVNLELKNRRRDISKEVYADNSVKDHPSIVYDEYVKEGTSIPSRKKKRDKNKLKSSFYPFMF